MLFNVSVKYKNNTYLKMFGDKTMYTQKQLVD